MTGTMKRNIKRSFTAAVLGLATLASGAFAQQQQPPGHKIPDGTRCVRSGP